MRTVRSVLLGAAVFVSLLLFGGVAFAQTTEVRGVIEAADDEGERQPVEGVRITVATVDGEEVGVAESGPDGQYSLELPGGGTYTATIDQESLPPDAVLRNPDRATLEFTVSSGDSRPLLFPLGESTRQQATNTARILQMILEGIKFGLIIAVTAIGLSLIFGTTGLVNFAHGELVSFGAIVTYLINVLLGIHLIPATIIALAFGAMTGAALELGLWRPLRRKGTGLIAALVVSIGLSLFWRYAMLFQFEGRTRPFAQFSVQRAISIGPVQIAPKDLISIALAIGVLLLVGFMLQRTKIGKAMRAVSDNKDLAESSGISVERVILFVWMLGGALATLGGVLLGLAEQVSWQMGFQLLLLMFAGVILGGLGTAYGALVGSLIVGIFVQTSTLVISPELKNVGAFLILILVLLVRPQGILGRSERIG